MFHPSLPGCTSVNMKVPMALSDEERRHLENLEQELAAADPDLNRILQSGLRRNRATARIVYGVLAP
ncbi:broad specificity phosphatase PhoE [Arthrobacter globiformis]|nr:broad specificity phosphatase PhoE [Arthrobacter globiformis]